MTSVDKIETAVSKLSEKINGLTFKFVSSNLESEAETAKQEAVAALENYLELVSQDWEERSQTEENEESDTNELDK